MDNSFDSSRTAACTALDVLNKNTRTQGLVTALGRKPLPVLSETGARYGPVGHCLWSEYADVVSEL